MDPYCAKYGCPATVVILRSVVSLITVADERPLMKVRGLFFGGHISGQKVRFSP